MTTPADKPAATTVAGKCPICGKPSQPATRPFCSRRCSDIDLGRWFGEGYRIPAPETPEDDETG